MKGWKTVIVAVLSFLAYALAWPELTQYLDGQTIAMITAAVMLIMRFLTTTSIFNGSLKKE